jgi:hypothetical protein
MGDLIDPCRVDGNSLRVRVRCCRRTRRAELPVPGPTAARASLHAFGTCRHSPTTWKRRTYRGSHRRRWAKYRPEALQIDDPLPSCTLPGPSAATEATFLSTSLSYSAPDFAELRIRVLGGTLAWSRSSPNPALTRQPVQARRSQSWPTSPAAGLAPLALPSPPRGSGRVLGPSTWGLKPQALCLRPCRGFMNQ